MTLCVNVGDVARHFAAHSCAYSIVKHFAKSVTIGHNFTGNYR